MQIDLSPDAEASRRFPEAGVMLTLSTAHLTPRDRRLLWSETLRPVMAKDATPDDPAFVICYVDADAAREGRYEDEVLRLSEHYWQIADDARAAGATFLRFDRDASESVDYPTFSDTEPT